ncbi:Uncharacterised protein [Mycobacteroides abscessus subsp. massiliense]|nr:Uncharacterised protein [Mycobacteroides abscessus subsp. massiliense]
MITLILILLVKDIDVVAKRIQNTINLRLHSKSNLQIIIIQIITVFLIKTTIRNLHNNANQYNLKILKTKQTLRIRRHLLNLHI